MKPPSVALLLALACTASAARAASPVDLVPLLARGARHPLADGSGRLAVTFAVPPGVDARALGLLPIAPGLATARVAPRDLPALLAAHPRLVASVRPPLHPVLDRANVLTGAGAYRARTGDDGRGVVVGVVDTGIDAAHPDFRDANGKTRIAWMLDLSRAPLGRHPELEHAYGCDDPGQAPCAVLDAKDIDESLVGSEAVPIPRDAVGHGTHVASIAAGDGADGAKTSAYVGIAPGATLVVVRATTDDGAGFTDADIVQGCRFIFDRASALEMPAVANVSIGSDYGAHAGTSGLEQGLAALVGADRPGRALVVAAGNSGVLYGDGAGNRLGTHVTVRVPPGDRVRIPVLSPQTAAGRTVNGQVDAWIAMRDGDSVSVGLDGPGERWIEQVAPGASDGYSPPGGEVSAAVVNGVTDDPSAAAAGTNAVVMWDGSWPGGSELAITLEGSGTVDVWVEGTGGAAPGADGPGILLVGATREGTINVPATSPDLISVGCTLDRSEWRDHAGGRHVLQAFGGLLQPAEDSACYFSAAGPTATGVMKPDLSAPGGMVAGAMARDQVPAPGRGTIFDAPRGACEGGVGDCFVVDSGHALLSGTSMSSPMVAGAIALLLQRDPSLAQPAIRTLLQAGARRPAGAVPYDWQLGPGTLDVEGTVAAHAALGNPLLAPEVDPARSWMALSASYARPDARLDVEGTVEVRTKDGGIADGFDGARLSLVVDGGEVRRPLSRVAPGLFRFAAGASPGTAAATMHVTVAWDGVPVGVAGAYYGARALPIAVDPFLARGGLEARGGCVASPGPARRPAPAALALVGLALAARLTARRASASRRGARTGRSRGRTAG